MTKWAWCVRHTRYVGEGHRLKRGDPKVFLLEKNERVKVCVNNGHLRFGMPPGWSMQTTKRKHPCCSAVMLLPIYWQLWQILLLFGHPRILGENPSTKTAYVRTIKKDEKMRDFRTICGLVYHLGSIHNMWINPMYRSASVDLFKSVIAIPHMWIILHSVDKSTAYNTQLRNPHFLTRSFL